MGKNRISKTKADAMCEQCIEILAKHGFRKQMYSRLESQYYGYFEEFLQFLGAREIIPDVVPGKTSNTPTLLNQESLDKLTLEMALVYARQGIGGVHFTESLNTLRSSIANLLEAMGYRSIFRLCSASRSKWDSYPEWVEIARIEGVSNPEGSSSD